ncbi:MAG: hypothetical protein ACI9CA_002419 [Natronomonas sp.]|jgi:hypothetical protein
MVCSVHRYWSNNKHGWRNSTLANLALTALSVGVFGWAPVSYPGYLPSLQRFKRKAHGFSRGMNPTARETLTPSAFAGCDTEPGVRIRTPLWR